MKKFFVCLIAVLILSLTAVPCFADGPNVSVGASTTNISVGQTVTVYVNLSANSNLTELNFKVTYPTTHFELVAGSAKASGVFAAASVTEAAGSVSFSGKSEKAVVAGGQLVSMQFKVLKGDATISISGVSGKSLNGEVSEAVSVGSTNLYFKPCAHANMTSETVKVASCTEKGKMKLTCPCGHTEEKEIPMLAHTFGEPEIKQPTCTEPGAQTKKCTKCGSEEIKSIDATGHRFDDTKITKEPTCTATGTQVKVCTVCGQEGESSTVPVKPHNFADSSIKKQPTCTEPGSAVGKCKDCPFESSSPVAIPANGHKFDKWSVTREPTLLMEGEQRRICKVCKEVETKQIPKLTSGPDEEITEPITNPMETPTQPITPIEPEIQSPIDNNINKPDNDKDDNDEKNGLAGLFGEEMSESDKSAVLVIVLCVVIVITLAVYVILLQQRKKKE